jgi:hypothetical protein
MAMSYLSPTKIAADELRSVGDAALMDANTANRAAAIVRRAIRELCALPGVVSCGTGAVCPHDLADDLCSWAGDFDAMAHQLGVARRAAVGA